MNGDIYMLVLGFYTMGGIRCIWSFQRGLHPYTGNDAHQPLFLCFLLLLLLPYFTAYTTGRQTPT